MQMKKIGVFFMVLACAVFLTGPVWAADNPRPAASQLVKNHAQRNGQALPQRTYVCMVDLLTEASSAGYFTVFALTNYDAISRIRIQGAVVPKDAEPGGEKDVDLWLNPYEVSYLPMSQYLKNQNGWAFLYSDTDFGCGALIFNTTNVQGLTWVTPWYWSFD
jgi:hypothetical protein